MTYWKDIIGEPTDEDVARFSPARSIKSIKAPILLIHATSDTTVPFNQSQNFERLLNEQGKHVQLVQLTGEDHWLSTSESRVKLLQSLESFLAAHARP